MHRNSRVCTQKFSLSTSDMSLLTGSQGQTLDLVCVGFGTAAISVAIALQENQALANTLFLDCQRETEWKPLHQPAASRMSTSLFNDLITLENPCSRFSFINYLHKTDQLVTFTNVSQLQPTRDAYTDYLRWCASHFQPHVAFGRRAIAIHGVHKSTGLIAEWSVRFEDVDTGEKTSVLAKQVLCAVGLQPRIPQYLSNCELRSSVVHSSSALDAIPVVLKDRSARRKFAIVGNGADAAGVFSHLHGIHGDHEVHWYTEGTVLKGSDGATW
jgi:L-ornithine N5-monooxygenase